MYIVYTVDMVLALFSFLWINWDVWYYEKAKGKRKVMDGGKLMTHLATLIIMFMVLSAALTTPPFNLLICKVTMRCTWPLSHFKKNTFILFQPLRQFFIHSVVRGWLVTTAYTFKSHSNFILINQFNIFFLYFNTIFINIQ